MSVDPKWHMDATEDRKDRRDYNGSPLSNAQCSIEVAVLAASICSRGTIGVDFAKKVFQAHRVDSAGKVIITRRRKQVIGLFSKIPGCAFRSKKEQKIAELTSVYCSGCELV